MPNRAKLTIYLEKSTADRFSGVAGRTMWDLCPMSDMVHSKRVFKTLFTPTRESALQQLHDFAPRAHQYVEGRDFDWPDGQAVSTLSPYIRHRLIAEREVAQEVLRHHAYKPVEKFLQELAWRTYWKGYLEMRPGIWRRFLHERERLHDEMDAGLGRRIEAATNARTGIACFDAWTEELLETGWLHNHARMWYASIWIFTLKLPWQLGAAFFLEHLIDGDPASNTLSWRWVGGLHTKGKHYLARAENIRRFTEGRFNPTGQLEEDAVPLPVDGVYESQPFATVAALRDVNFPSLSSCPAGLLVTPEDLSPESGELSETPFSSLCVFSAGDILSTCNATDKVRGFISAAVDDAAARLARHWDGKVVACRDTVVPMVGKASPDHVGRKERMRVYGGTVNEWVESVVTWARNENLNSVWMMRPPVGPWADALPELKGALHQRGIRLFEYRRRWDSLHWPHATAGYFRFKEGLQERVRRALAPQP